MYWEGEEVVLVGDITRSPALPLPPPPPERRTLVMSPKVFNEGPVVVPAGERMGTPPGTPRGR